MKQNQKDAVKGDLGKIFDERLVYKRNLDKKVPVRIISRFSSLKYEFASIMNQAQTKKASFPRVQKSSSNAMPATTVTSFKFKNKNNKISTTAKLNLCC